MLLILLTSTSAIAYDYPDTIKKEFYDGVIGGISQGARESLLSRGYEKNSVEYVVQIMSSRINRTELENKTWNCVKQYDLSLGYNEKMLYCFDDWHTNFMQKNTDLSKMLKR